MLEWAKFYGVAIHTVDDDHHRLPRVVSEYLALRVLYDLTCTTRTPLNCRSFQGHRESSVQQRVTWLGYGYSVMRTNKQHKQESRGIVTEVSSNSQISTWSTLCSSPRRPPVHMLPPSSRAQVPQIHTSSVLFGAVVERQRLAHLRSQQLLALQLLERRLLLWRCL